MSAFSDQNNPGLREGDRINGYHIKRIAELKEINSFFYELAHEPTGAKHVHISNNDTENTFGVTFKTVPLDATGVAHILEHTTLCGSKKFSVRDPFFSMRKRSLNTFMNAMTASDWTMYPFSSQNRKDLYNLMDVYLDAAFFPNLDRLSFKQEGHRLDIEEDGNLVYKGVVYNEMKGAMSSPDQVMIRSLMNALYPETTYGNNSGGDPAVIPTLTREQLRAFHIRHYHPSNAFFYTYGNLPLKDHLAFVSDKVFSSTWERIDPNTDVPSQPRWDQPKAVTYRYPLDQNEDPSKKCQVCVAWLTADVKDSYELLTLGLLEHVLLGTPASPMRKALMDSGLGTALCDATGFDGDNRDTLFAFGLKNVRESDAAAVEQIIFDLLRELSDKGMDKELIDSAVHQIEFHRKEVTNTPYPYGLKLLFSLSAAWIHGGDPLRILRFDDDLERLERERAEGPLFEDRIKRYFLGNPHQVLFKLVPDQEMAQKETERVRTELERVKTAISPLELDKIREDADALKRLQESDENLSLLPTLQLTDIPPSVQSVSENLGFETGDLTIPLSFYDQPTSGIFYFSSVVGVRNLAKAQVPLLPFFCYALPKIGTTRRDYTEIAREMDACTGGLGLSVHARTDFGGTDNALPFLSFSGKCLVRNEERMFALIKELLCEFAFSDLTRLKTLLLEFRAGMEAGIVHNGHVLAISLASRNYCESRALNEIWNGIHHLQTIKAITDDLAEGRLTSLADQLTSIGNRMLTRDNFRIALIGEEAALSAAVPHTVSLQNALREGNAQGLGAPEIDLGPSVLREGWSTSSAVSFVVRACKTVRMAHEDAPALAVFRKMLHSLYLHREIREKGGAYGGMATYNPEDGIFCMASYRDPHIASTLKVYDHAMGFVRSGKFGGEDVKEAILQVCSDIDKPDPPGAAARRAFYRKIVSLSDEARKQYKERLLGVTRDQVLRVAKTLLDQDGEKQAVAVISSEDKLKEANEKMPDRPLTLHRI